MKQRQRAYIVHRTMGRLRIKVAGQRHNARFFQNLRRQLIDDPEVVEIEVNPRTASVLIKHRGGFDLNVLRNPFLELDFDGAGTQLRARPAAERQVTRLDNSIQRLTGGEVDLATFLVKLALAVVTRQPPLQFLGWIAEVLVRAFIKSKTASLPRISAPLEPQGLLAAA
jgi:hypothetical protein